MLKSNILNRGTTKFGEIVVYDVIGSGLWGGVSAKEVYNELHKLEDADSLVVRVNSPGGDAAEAINMFNLFRTDQRPVEVIVDGWAVSAASVVAMAGDTITMGVGASMMIHLPWTFAAGDADELRKAAEGLDTATSGLIDIYATQTSKTENEIRALMAEETWFTAQEAVDAGFATHVDENLAAVALVRDRRIQSHFSRVPADVIAKGLKYAADDEKRRNRRIAKLLTSGT